MNTPAGVFFILSCLSHKHRQSLSCCSQFSTMAFPHLTKMPVTMRSTRVLIFWCYVYNYLSEYFSTSYYSKANSEYLSSSRRLNIMTPVTAIEPHYEILP